MLAALLPLGGGEPIHRKRSIGKTGKGSDYIAEAKDAQSRISKLQHA